MILLRAIWPVGDSVTCHGGDPWYSKYSLRFCPEQRFFQGFVLQTEQLTDGTQFPRRLIIGVSGASGSIYAVRLLTKLGQRDDIETHLVVSRSGEKTLFLETGMRLPDLKTMAARCYPPEDISAPLASGSYRTEGMVILPCSIHTMSSIAAGISSNLLVRAADVTLKERRRLILGVRETPFHLGHLRTMVALSEMGAIIAPPIPAFYHQPTSVEDLVDGTVQRILDLLGVPDPDARRWNGPHQS
jgi:4-hydroxy-3-polyprenylbenzoate decarboxylase